MVIEWEHLHSKYHGPFGSAAAGPDAKPEAKPEAKPLGAPLPVRG
jgi:hypothetical protein